MNIPSNSLFKFIIHFLKPHPFAIGALILLGMASGCYSTINAYLTKVIIDSISTLGQNADLFATLGIPALCFLLNYEAHNLCWRGIQFANIKASAKIQNQIIHEMFGFTEKHAFRYFQDNFSGTISNNISTLADNIFNIISYLVPFLIRQSTQVLLAVISLFLINPYFGLALALWVIVFVFISLVFSTKIMTYADDLAMSHALLNGKITDSVSNSNNVRLFAREKYELQYLNTFLDDALNKYQRKEWFYLKLSLIQSISITLLIGVLLYVLFFLKMQNLVSVGDFAFILGLSLYVTEGVWYGTEQVIRLIDLVGRSNQSLKMLMTPLEVQDKSDACELKVRVGQIGFKDVTFQYKEQRNIFENKSVIIEGGQRVGLVGYSGSGKTTFVNLIVRLFDVSSGIITIDSQDISRVTQRSLRDKIGFIPQDPILFHRSLLENIRYGNINATDEEVFLAAQLAHAHEFIMQSPQAYQSLVGERGIKLSGGQRQRISIARAILKNAPILILDEATSALDSVTEGYIQESLNTLMNNKTVIVVAHRLSTLLKMDRILVFDQGKIVEDGTHQQLLAQKGMYAKLWNSQVGGFLLDEGNEFY